MPPTLQELADLYVSLGPREAVYDDGGGPWHCVTVYEEPRGEGPLNPGGTVVAATASGGSSLSWHAHFTASDEPATEVLTVLCGVVTVCPEGREPLILAPGMTFPVPPGVPHRIAAQTDVCLTATSIPTCRGLPHDAESDEAASRAGLRGADGECVSPNRDEA